MAEKPSAIRKKWMNEYKGYLKKVGDTYLIKMPGRLEGEPLYVAYFDDAHMDGFYDEEFFGPDGLVEAVGIKITKEDAKVWPELKDDVGNYIMLFFSETGFVSNEIVEELPEQEPYPDFEEDIFIRTTGRLGGKYIAEHYGKQIGSETPEWDDIVKEVKKYMKREQYWPDVWFIDDHGGWTRVTVSS